MCKSKTNKQTEKNLQMTGVRKKKDRRQGHRGCVSEVKQDGSLALTGHSLRTNSPPDVECPA